MAELSILVNNVYLCPRVCQGFGQDDLERRLAVGLFPIPCWGGGRALPGTHFAALADSPLTREQILAANYRGGLAILCGTAHPEGGYVLGIDIDRGAETQTYIAKGFLYLEGGTTPGKWHLFLRSTDRLEGQINLLAGSQLVAEVKGRGRALRSWPTLPQGKPRGYRPIRLAKPQDLANDPPTLTAHLVAEGLAEHLSHVLGEDVRISDPSNRYLYPIPRLATSPRANFVTRLEATLDQAGCHLRPGRDGWLNGCCPFHDDRRPSFGVNFDRGCWVCLAGCGSGSLRGLALSLGIIPPIAGHKSRHIPDFEVVI